MSSSFQLGPFAIKVQGLALIFAIFMSYWVVKYHLKRLDTLDSSVKEQIKETVEKGAVLALFVWKFSLLFFHPLQSISNPLALLYYSGDERGMGLAAAATFTYFYFQARKERIKIEVYGELFVSSFLTGSIVYYLFALGEAPSRISVYGTEDLLALFLYYFYFWKSISQQNENAKFKNILHSFMWYNLGQAFISFLNPLKQNLVWGFSSQQIFYLTLALVCITIDFWKVETKTN